MTSYGAENHEGNNHKAQGLTTSQGKYLKVEKTRKKISQIAAQYISILV